MIEMTRKILKEKLEAQLEGMLTPEIGPLLEVAGSLCKEIWHEKNGVYLDADDRKVKQQTNDVLAVVDSVSHIEIKLGNGKVLSFGNAKPDKPAMTIPYGMSDRINTAAMPKDWLPMALYQHLVDVYEGDTTFAQDVADYLNKCIDAATEISEEGRLSINKKKLPTPSATVFTQGLVESHKRMFKSKTKGSTVFNLTCSIEDIQDDQPLRIPPRLTGFISPNIIETPVAPPMTSRPHTLQSEATEDKEADEGGMSVSDHLFNVLGNDPLTKGMIRKAIADNVPEPMWVAELDKLVKEGIIIKDASGGPRSTKYVVVSPIPDLEVIE